MTQNKPGQSGQDKPKPGQSGQDTVQPNPGQNQPSGGENR